MKLFQKVKENRKKKNNKGFSLVELIIVIAIMAILIAVLAPQFTKYVDRSRQSNDATTVSGIVNAIQAGVTDAEYGILDGIYEVKLTDSTTTVDKAAGSPATANPDKLKDAIEAACGPVNKMKATAKAWGTEGIVITATVNAASGTSIKYSTEFGKYIEKK